MCAGSDACKVLVVLALSDRSDKALTYFIAPESRPTTKQVWSNPRDDVRQYHMEQTKKCCYKFLFLLLSLIYVWYRAKI